MPLRHFAPGVVQSVSLLHDEVPPVLVGSQVGVPLVSLHTKFEGHPDDEQSPAWHLLSFWHCYFGHDRPMRCATCRSPCSWRESWET